MWSFCLRETLQLIDNTGWPLVYILFLSFFSPVLAYGLTDLQVQFVDTEKLDQQRKKLCATKDINRLHFVSARSLSLCSFSHFYSLVTQLNAILPLCFSHCMDPSTSLSLSLSILGFTVSIPEGRSIDCNSLSMKSPLCYWRKEMSFNRTDNSLLLFFLIAPSLPFYKYNLLLPLFCARCEEDDREAVWGSSQRPRLEACLMISWERYWGTITPQAL